MQRSFSRPSANSLRSRRNFVSSAQHFPSDCATNFSLLTQQNSLGSRNKILSLRADLGFPRGRVTFFASQISSSSRGNILFFRASIFFPLSHQIRLFAPRTLSFPCRNFSFRLRDELSPAHNNFPPGESKPLSFARRASRLCYHAELSLVCSSSRAVTSFRLCERTSLRCPTFVFRAVEFPF